MQTLTQVIKEDHDEMYRYYAMFEKALKDNDPDAVGRWGNQLRWEVARHAAGEEIVVYPLLEKHLGDEGKRLADEDREQHLQVKKLLKDAENYDAGSLELTNIIKEVIEHLKPHNESEEKNDLPALEKVIGEENSREAAKSFSRTKKFVPTHAHPALPDKPPYETLGGFLVTPMDKLKDFFASFPTDEMKQESKQVWAEGGERQQVGL
jgi:hemerythrin superfamily protein